MFLALRTKIKLFSLTFWRSLVIFVRAVSVSLGEAGVRRSLTAVDLEVTEAEMRQVRRELEQFAAGECLMEKGF